MEPRTWIWIGGAVALALAVLLLASALASRRRSSRRTERLRSHFGREYDHVIADHGRRGPAEAELEARLERRQALEVRSLPSTTRDSYRSLWAEVDRQAVMAPAAALGFAHGLVTDIMREQGYPVDDFDHRAADISVGHPEVAEDYRRAREVLFSSDSGSAAREELEEGLDGIRRVMRAILSEPARPRAGDRIVAAP